MHRILTAFELTTHGVPWIIVLGMLIWMSPLIGLQNYFVNMFFATIVDIIVVASVKSYARRRRPPLPEGKSEMAMTFGPDKFSFPSGHASRSVLMALLMSSSTWWLLPWTLFLYFWASCVCLSRILLGRHFVGDVLGGAALGVFQYFFMCRLWLSEAVTSGLLSLFFDDNGVVEFE